MHFVMQLLVRDSKRPHKCQQSTADCLKISIYSGVVLINSYYRIYIIAIGIMSNLGASLVKHVKVTNDTPI